MTILGLSCFYHDSAACLVVDGKIVAAVQEERFTRKKHDESFPKHSVAYCLNIAGIKIDQVDLVVFYEKPFVKFERLLETYLAYAPQGLKSYLKALPVWLHQKLWIPKVLADKLDFKGKILYTEHHLAHAASAFYPSPFKESAVLTIDGVGEWATTTWGVGRGRELELRQEITFPHSLGLLYSAFTYYTGFKVNSGEYKLMGLAPYGKPRYVKDIYEHLVDVKPDGSFRLNLDYFNYPVGLTMTNHKFNQLFGGPPRLPESPLTQKEMDLAASIQVVTEDIVLKIAKDIKQKTGARYLCLAGGVALNCVANGKLAASKVFDEIWIQPAAGDAGGALGAALYAWYSYLGQERLVDGFNNIQQGTLLGPAFSNEEIKKSLDQDHAVYNYLADEELFKYTANKLAESKVVGWFQGRMEFGPRALGNRSILGDARFAEMQTELNLKIKFRESFRPFAPAVLAESATDYFDLNQSSPYMLITAPVKSSQRLPVNIATENLWGVDKLKVVRSYIPAVTHVDYSARVQTVTADFNQRFYDLLKEFKTLTNCPVVINTSFNVRGEPIVCTPADAYRCFRRTNMDVLVLGNYVLVKESQPDLVMDNNWQKEFTLD